MNQTHQSIDTDIKAYDFAKEVLKENFRSDTFQLQFNDRRPKLFNQFSEENLDKIVAFSDKNYPKNSLPQYYDHFTLVVFTYLNSKAAERSFDELVENSRYGIRDLQNLDEQQAKKAKAMAIYAKYGGLIVQQENLVLALIETCRSTPIGGTWINYEEMFLRYISTSRTELKVLNADCGMDKFILEYRKTKSR